MIYTVCFNFLMSLNGIVMNVYFCIFVSLYQRFCPVMLDCPVSLFLGFTKVAVPVMFYHFQRFGFFIAISLGCVFFNSLIYFSRTDVGMLEHHHSIFFL